MINNNITTNDDFFIDNMRKDYFYSFDSYTVRTIPGGSYENTTIIYILFAKSTNFALK